MKKLEAYLGVDSGSSSMKFAITGKDRELIDSVYLKNHGLLKTMKEGLNKVSNDYEIKGCGVTGSGRNFLGLLMGADSIRTEILAHSVGTLHYYPKVSSLLDVGAEDCKAIFFNDGIIEDFVMNLSCSAGTSSSLEAIANRMGIKIEDVGGLALKSKNKLNISTKCGVFMQSACVTYLNSGAKKEDILWGVVRSMAGNFLQMTQGKSMKPPYVFQGAAAKNKSLVKAFEEQLNHEVIIPEYCDIMGAIGSSFLVQKENPEKTKFKGFEIVDKDYQPKSFISNRCENHCEITQLFEDGKYIGSLGNRCEDCIPKKYRKKVENKEEPLIKNTPENKNKGYWFNFSR